MTCSAHAFTPPVRPEDCVCDPLAHEDPSNIPPVCDTYASHDDLFLTRVCIDCSHDYECHKAVRK